MNKLLFLLLIGLLIASCKQDNLELPCEQNCLIFEGTIFDKNRDIPVDDAKVKLYHISEGAWWSLTETLITQTKTDDFGDFQMKIAGDDYKDNWGFFKLIIDKRWYLLNEEEGNKRFYKIDSTNFGVPIDGSMILYPKAFLKIKAKTDKVTDVGYKFKYNHTGYGYFIEENIEYEFIHEVASEQFVTIEYRYRKNDRWSQKVDSIFIETAEEKEFILDFD